MKNQPSFPISEETGRQLITAIGELVCTINRQIDSTSRITGIVSKDREIKGLEKERLTRIAESRTEALVLIRDTNKQHKKAQ